MTFSAKESNWLVNEKVLIFRRNGTFYQHSKIIIEKTFAKSRKEAFIKFNEKIFSRVSNFRSMKVQAMENEEISMWFTLGSIMMIGI